MLLLLSCTPPHQFDKVGAALNVAYEAAVAGGRSLAPMISVLASRVEGAVDSAGIAEALSAGAGAVGAVVGDLAESAAPAVATVGAAVQGAAAEFGGAAGEAAAGFGKVAAGAAGAATDAIGAAGGAVAGAGEQFLDAAMNPEMGKQVWGKANEVYAMSSDALAGAGAAAAGVLAACVGCCGGMLSSVKFDIVRDFYQVGWLGGVVLGVCDSTLTLCACLCVRSNWVCSSPPSTRPRWTSVAICGASSPTSSPLTSTTPCPVSSRPSCSTSSLASSASSCSSCSSSSCASPVVAALTLFGRLCL